MSGSTRQMGRGDREANELPMIARAILRISLPRHRRDDVTGDLLEVHRVRHQERGAGVAAVVTSAEALWLGLAFQWIRVEESTNAVVLPSWLDVRLGFRRAGRQPLMTATLFGALTAGLAIAITGFTALSGLFGGSLTFDPDQRFVRLDVETLEERRYARLGADHHHAFSASSSFLFFGAEDTDPLSLLLPSGAIEPVRANWITPGVFAHLPVRPLRGRVLEHQDERTGAEPTVLIRERLWRRSLGADPAIIGRSLNVAGEVRRVVGVLPDSARFPSSPDIWLPLQAPPAEAEDAELKSGLMHFGVLGPDATPAEATLELQALAQRLDAARPERPAIRVAVVPFTQGRASERRAAMVMVLVLLLLLGAIAANLAQLTATRVRARSRELAIRGALGAERGRMVCHLATESLLVCLVSGCAALGASRVAIRFVSDRLEAIPFWVDFGIGWRHAVFTAVAVGLAWSMSGILPALRATRTSTDSLRGGAGRTPKLEALATAAQMGLAVLLLAGAFGLAGSLRSQSDRDLPIDTDAVLTARIHAPIPASEARRSPLPSSDLLLEQIRGIPGVGAAAVASVLPRQQADMTTVELDGEGHDRISVVVVDVTPDFLQALSISPILGRDLEPADARAEAPAAALVTRTFVERFLGEAPPLGARVRTKSAEGDPSRWIEVVGVVPDLGLDHRGGRPGAALLLPTRSPPYPVQIAVGTAGPSAQFSSRLWTEVSRLDPRLQVTRVLPLSQLGGDSDDLVGAMSGVLVIVGLLVLLLCAVTLYSIASAQVARRTREIGIRLALGASRRGVAHSVVERTVRISIVGLGIGMACTLVVWRAQVSERAFDLASAPLMTILPPVIVVLLIASLGSVVVPLRRALAIAPREALQEDR